jgi:fructosamine-3-kinase
LSGVAEYYRRGAKLVTAKVENISEGLSQALNVALGKEVVAAEKVSGGSISNACLVQLSDDKRYFVKWNFSAPKDFFSREAAGLEALRKSKAVTVPDVILVEEEPESAPPFIVLEELKPGKKNRAAERKLGEQLAALHSCHDEFFGFHSDNFIGIMPQDNTQNTNWSQFFYERRLKPQIKAGKEDGWFDVDLEELLDNAELRIRALMEQHYESPSLLHGDLWSGNVFWSKAGPVLIDPAVYYGLREADIAFSQLFGGFGSDFYQAYNDVTPLAKGFELRKDVFNLYHLMNHANLFGGAYIEQVRDVLSEI